MGPTKNTDQVRRQILTFMDNGGMKVSEFCDTLGVSNGAYNRFLQQSGRDKGLNSDVYLAAWQSFDRRESLGMKMPNKKQKRDKDAGKSSSSGSKDGSKTAKVDISGIHLDGEHDDSVEVYDTCDEIRRKITAHLQKDGVTKAQFCRDPHALLNSPNAPQKIQSSQLDRFRRNKGPNNGCTSSVYYAAYVFFEKQRLAEGKPKSKGRKDMEEIWPTGMERDTDGKNRHFWCLGSERPHSDKYGRMSFY